MKKTKALSILIAVFFLFTLPAVSFADLQQGEKGVYDDFRAAIPKDKF